MADYVTGCTHFGHANIIKLANRPFGSVTEMDEALVDNWNQTVRPQDTVYHLGDFAFHDATAETYLQRLHGNIVCLQGNHDPKGWGRDYMTVRSNRVRAVLFHYPIEEWDGWFRGNVHLHCHTHAPEFISGERRGNVGVDATGFRPMRLDHAIARLTET
ncbi:Calcineurin-like phosphoesterase superfamily protein [Aliiroseovarius halocynthiae]|uniref:Metallophosphoesterase n=1 Tax=Aliiroseovarius halocynthiae TaxID=985055 RepID=A0A545SUV0_9RHOB|nr:metallophosphoesterase [Aliiroseovarius halocynthiae]TQV68728.1 metallophosphoesterase [Aliiroseovarius halocynthiae]SMR71150.1 Calcineurin-like phosphoesterase superfamily protein [Aliiroseovarius halocynthiae]